MSHTAKKLIVIGKIGSVHGIAGWLKVLSFTEPPENILSYSPWQLLLNNKQEEIKAIEHKINNDRLLIQIAGCTDRDLARRYTGAEIAIYRDQLPPLPPQEYYWTDLEGMEVLTTDNRSLGKVDHVLATGSNDVLVIKGTKRYLIPFLLNNVILAVDLATNIIRVDWDPDF